MPNITIYLDKELYEYVAQKPSAIIQEALREHREKRTPKKPKSA